VSSQNKKKLQIRKLFFFDLRFRRRVFYILGRRYRIAGKELAMGHRRADKKQTGVLLELAERRALEYMARAEMRNLTQMVRILVREGAEKRGIAVDDVHGTPEMANA